MPDLSHERRCSGPVAGLDEAGRGPWAGPVVAAAVVLERRLPAALSRGLDDSKKLPKPRREALFAALADHAAIGIGRAEVAEIDAVNILEAAMRAMARALAALPAPPDHALVDGNRAPALPCAATCLVGGDGLSLSVAAASIIAKVTRDREMVALAERYPGYAWERNAGYGTAGHRAALLRLGVTPEHRRSFAPVARMLCPDWQRTRHVGSNNGL